MRLGRFLVAVQGFGPVRTRRLIRNMGWTSGTWDRRIGPGDFKDNEIPMTRRQREALAGRAGGGA